MWWSSSARRTTPRRAAVRNWWRYTGSTGWAWRTPHTRTSDARSSTSPGTSRYSRLRYATHLGWNTVMYHCTQCSHDRMHYFPSRPVLVCTIGSAALRNRCQCSYDPIHYFPSRPVHVCTIGSAALRNRCQCSYDPIHYFPSRPVHSINAFNCLGGVEPDQLLQHSLVS